jgi:hypothetical protein
MLTKKTDAKGNKTIVITVNLWYVAEMLAALLVILWSR